MAITIKLIKTVAFSTAAIALASISSTAQASTCIGACGTLGADGDISAPPGGTTYGYVSTAGGLAGAGQITSVGGTNGSEFISDNFSATAGELLKFDFNYITSDGTGSFPDYGFAELQNSLGATVAYLFTARTVAGAGDTSPGFGLPANAATLTPGTTPIIPGASNWSPLGSSSGGCFGGTGNGCGSTGWINSVYTIGTTGSYRIRFGATNFGDFIVDSGLAYAGLKIGSTEIPVGSGAVPEPATWAMMIGGFGMVGGSMRYRRRKTTVSFA